MANLKLSGDTSGVITVAAPAVSGTNTLTLPATTGTLHDENSTLLSSNLSGALPAIDGSSLTGITSGGMTLLATINTTSGTSHTTGTISLTGYKTIFIYGWSVGNTGAAGRLRITPNGGTAQKIYSNPSGDATKSMYGLYIQDLATGSLLSNFKVDADRSQTQIAPVTYNGVNGGCNQDLSATTTSIVFDWDGGETFDVGQITVYAIS
jgi:hypothetical protein